MKSLIVFSMGCSGHHAVVNWICNQETPSIYFNNIRVDNDELLIKNYVVAYTDKKVHKWRCHRSIIPPEFIDWYDDNSSILSRVLYVVVNEKISENFHFANAVDGDVTFVIILRDIYNTIASRRYRKLPVTKAIHRAWIDCVKVCLGDIDLPDDTKLVDISFNDWFKSKEYRRQIAERLDMPFTDKGLNEIHFIGNGAFKDGNVGQNRDVLNRWKVVDLTNDISDEEKKLSDRYFGKLK